MRYFTGKKTIYMSELPIRVTNNKWKDVEDGRKIVILLELMEDKLGRNREEK